jgi:hypothetical protein
VVTHSSLLASVPETEAPVICLDHGSIQNPIETKDQRPKTKDGSVQGHR